MRPNLLSSKSLAFQLNEEAEPVAIDPEEAEDEEKEQEEAASAVAPDRDSDRSSPPVRFSRTCLKNFFSVLLILVYLLLMGVAVFLVYQTITDFRDKLKHPVMSVSYKEVNMYDAPGIALYPGKARLLSCEHHWYDHIPPLKDPGQPGENTCVTQDISYIDPYTNKTMKHALIVQGPRDVRRRELVFLQFHLNETKQDFSAIDYLLFSSYEAFLKSHDQVKFMQDCESSFSSWKFSGGFRTWVKMSLVKTKEEDGSQSVEFRQETSVVNFIDRRETPDKGDQLFFVVFEWKDPYIQEIQDIITANPWSMIALLCSVFLVLFKAADFAKLSVKWMIKVRRRHLKKRARELNHIS
uniref:Proton-activated chloride channel n=1 Tax=Xenopus tropicalis TaxID=8364 RepID=F6Y5Y2_XENTR